MTSGIGGSGFGQGQRSTHRGQARGLNFPAGYSLMSNAVNASGGLRFRLDLPASGRYLPACFRHLGTEEYHGTDAEVGRDGSDPLP